MARGWESKTIESQIETAQDDALKRPRPVLTRVEADLQIKRQGLLLTRTRVLKDLANARNERYRNMLKAALGKLEEDLAALDSQP
jgi:hypothetical protein